MGISRAFHACRGPSAFWIRGLKFLRFGSVINEQLWTKRIGFLKGLGDGGAFDWVVWFFLYGGLRTGLVPTVNRLCGSTCLLQEAYRWKRLILIACQFRFPLTIWRLRIYPD